MICERECYVSCVVPNSQKGTEDNEFRIRGSNRISLLELELEHGQREGKEDRREAVRETGRERKRTFMTTSKIKTPSHPITYVI